MTWGSGFQSLIVKLKTKEDGTVEKKSVLFQSLIVKIKTNKRIRKDFENGYVSITHS